MKSVRLYSTYRVYPSEIEEFPSPLREHIDPARVMGIREFIGSWDSDDIAEVAGDFSGLYGGALHPEYMEELICYLEYKIGAGVGKVEELEKFSTFLQALVAEGSHNGRTYQFQIEESWF